MPPKKGTTGQKSADSAPAASKQVQQGVASSKKRKQTDDTSDSQKAARRSARGAPKSKPSQLQLLNYLLSKSAEELCRPDDESEAIQSHEHFRTYSSSVLNPFEELLCAVILSRPISHRLGLRTIRTILNDPYNFTSAKAVKDAGESKIHEAIWEAKTQHKQKTADEISMVANVVMDKYSSSKDKEGKQMQKVLDESGRDVDKAVEKLKEDMKGFGATGSNIFLRRVQWIWDGAYPFVDDRTSNALKKLGLPEDAEGLQKLLEEQWKQLDTKNIAGDNEASKKRRAFVVALERAIGSDLEGKTDDLLSAAVN